LPTKSKINYDYEEETITMGTFSFSCGNMLPALLKGENIDEGIEPDYQLESLDDFFDIAKVGKLIEEFYSGAKQ